jgi:hypothetical protein
MRKSKSPAQRPRIKRSQLSPSEKVTKDFCVPRPMSLGQRTFEQIDVVRNAAFDELYRYDIPQCLIEAVRHFQWNAKVHWRISDGTALEVTEHTYPVLEENPRQQGLNECTKCLNASSRSRRAHLAIPPTRPLRNTYASTWRVFGVHVRRMCDSADCCRDP